VSDATSEAQPVVERDLTDSALYFNRELSWLQFNARVLELAEDPAVPLLERLKFLAIYSSNLDEFFMVRVAGLKRRTQNRQTLAQVQGTSRTRARIKICGRFSTCKAIIYIDVAGLRPLLCEQDSAKQNRQHSAYCLNSHSPHWYHSVQNRL